MQNPNNYLFKNQDDTADYTSPQIRSNQWVTASFMCFFSENTAAGTIQLEFSNDPLFGVPPNDFTPTNWMNVPGTQATASVSSGGSVVVYPPTNFVAQWYRIVFTQSGGSGTFSCIYNALFV